MFPKLRGRLKRGKVDVGRYEAPPPSEPVPVEEIAAEGALIAASAVRMTVKNRQIVRALRDRGDYREKEAIAAAREVYRALAREKRDDAQRLADIRERARDRPGKATHQTDYRDGDSDRLARRQEVSALLAERLEQLSEDDEYLRGIVTTALEAAWAEIGSSITAQLDRQPERDVDTPGYRAARDRRVKELIAIDFALLEASREPEY